MAVATSRFTVDVAVVANPSVAEKRSVMNSQTSPSPFSPITIGPLTLKNRFIKAATNEGMSAQGVPSKQLVKFHSALASGGIALTTVAYCAVSSDGRTLPNQLTLVPASLPHFKTLTDGVHQAGGLASDGQRRVLDIPATALHQRVAVFMGSKNEIERINRYHAEA